MSARPTLTATDLTLTAIAGVIMIIAVPILFPSLNVSSAPGLSFDLTLPYHNDPLITQGITSVLLLLCAGASILLNRHYNFIKGTDNSFAAFLFILCATDPLTVCGYSYPVLILALEIMCLYLLFGCYKSPDATQPIYLAAVAVMSISMITRSALVMIPVLLIGMFIMNIVRPREIMAFGMGLLTPWWILTGFGVINPLDTVIPELSLPGTDVEFTPLSIGIIISLAFTFIFSGLLNIDNSFSKMSGNIRTRALNRTITWCGLIALLFMIIDSEHFRDYSAVLYFTAAMQAGNFFSIHNFHSGRKIELGVLALYTIFFGVAIYLNTI